MATGGGTSENAKAENAKAAGAFRTIREVSDEIGVPAHVLRFWETRFPQLKPLQRGGNRRYYRPADVELAAALHALLHRQGMTVKGVQMLIKTHGAQSLAQLARVGILAPPEPAPSESASDESAPGKSAPGEAQVADLRRIRDRLLAALAA